MEIFLERPIVGTILTQFLPTTLFLVIRDSISFLKVNFIEVFFSQAIVFSTEDFFDMVIQVNLTVLLVLTTL